MTLQVCKNGQKVSCWAAGKKWCAKLWPDLMTNIEITAEYIFTRFQLRAQLEIESLRIGQTWLSQIQILYCLWCTCSLQVFSPATMALVRRLTSWVSSTTWLPASKATMVNVWKKTEPLWCCSPDSRFAPSQWETPLLCNAVSHWLDASL